MMRCLWYFYLLESSGREVQILSEKIRLLEFGVGNEGNLVFYQREEKRWVWSSERVWIWSQIELNLNFIVVIF